MKRPAYFDLVKSPLFVTWNKGGNADENLRGCQGHMAEDAKLGEQLERFSLKAAFSDKRFPPIKPKELP